MGGCASFPVAGAQEADLTLAVIGESIGGALAAVSNSLVNRRPAATLHSAGLAGLAGGQRAAPLATAPARLDDPRQRGRDPAPRAPAAMPVIESWHDSKPDLETAPAKGPATQVAVPSHRYTVVVCA